MEQASAAQQTNWQQAANDLAPRNQAFINGKFMPAEDGQTFDNISPVNGQSLGPVAACGARDIDKAVSAARACFESGVWRDLAPAERKNKLFAFADAIERHADELALLETMDMGKPIGDSTAIDVPAAIGCLRWFAEAIDKIYDEVAPTPGDVLATITREPMGVIGAVVPWNFPLLMAMWKIAPALAAGNAVVLKPAEQSPLTAIRLAEIAMEAGLPAGLLNVVPGFGETAGQALGLHPDVDMVAFTGSTEVGKLFLQYSGQSNMKHVSLECGGKSPHIIMDDAPDMDAAADTVMTGAFFNQGEVCTCGSRLLVAESIHDDFVARLLARCEAWQTGNPLDMGTRVGALVDKGHMGRVLDYIKYGKEDGAELLTGGTQARNASGGFYVSPTIFNKVTPDMRIAREEIFGPVLSVLTFRDEEEAIKIANDTHYGLAASVWTSNLRRAHTMTRALRAGMVWVNCYNADNITVPFGGYKQSGIGRDKSLHALDKYTEMKTTWINLQY